ncbi:MAG: HEPN domain-containing protein [Bacteroidota bacterium]
MAEIDRLYSDTEGYIKNLEITYLSRYIADKTSSPTDYNNDVKSFCILSHAAFEEYTETIAIIVMDKTVDNFVTHHRITESLVSLMHFKANGDAYLSKSEDDDKIEIITSYDYIRLRLAEIKERFSKEVFNNHGVSLKYIKQLLMPVSIDISSDPILLNSLKLLAKERGSYAHKFLEKGSIKKSIAPEDAKTIVTDCLRLCFDIKEKAKVKI